MRAIVNKVLAKGQSESSRAPTLAILLQPRTSRNFSREVEEWLVSHDVVSLLESLTAHLLRTLPHDEIEETDKWLDAHKVSRVATTAVPKEDVRVNQVVQEFPTHSIVQGVWMKQEVTCMVVNRHVKGLSPSALKGHQHRLACMTATGPQLSTIVHENLLSTFGYWVTEESIGLIHQRYDPRRSVLDMVRVSQQHLDIRWILKMGRDVLTGLGHMHTLGFLHRNVNLECVYECQPGHFILGGFDMTVRSSRGRVASPSWAPRVPAPETLHARTFETSTDVYAFGILLWELANYGVPLTLPLAVDKPEHMPMVLWNVISVCLSLSRDARPTCSGLSAKIDELLAMESTLGLIPLPSEQQVHVTGELLNGLRAAKCSPDILTAVDGSLKGMDAVGWPVALEALRLNQHLKSLTISQCTVSPAPLDCLRLERFSCDALCCIDATGRDCIADVFSCAMRPLIVRSGTMLTHLRLAHMPSLGSLVPNFDGFIESLAVTVPSLQSLGLVHLGLTSDAFRALGEVLGEPGAFPALRQLEFGSGDTITSHGMGYLCTALQRDRRVANLILDGAVLDYFAVSLLGQLIRESHSLERISLAGVHLSECGRRLIVNGCKAGSTDLTVVTDDPALT